MSNPKTKFLAIFETMCGASVCGVENEPGKREPDLYGARQEWLSQQADILEEQILEVRTGTREPSEVGSDEILVEVLVYEDGRITDAAFGIIDYRVIFDRDN